MNRKYQSGFIMMAWRGIFWLLIMSILVSVFFTTLGAALRAPDAGNKLTVKPKIGGTVIGFFNGVNTTHQTALRNQQRISDCFGNRTASGQPIQYQLFYNDSYGLTLDLIETFDQRAALLGLDGRYDLFWRLIAGQEVRSQPSASEVLVSLFSSKTIDYLRALQRSQGLKTSAEHRRLIHQLTTKGVNRKLILVAHSQGNLYALPAYDQARQRHANLSVVHAAPPIDITRGEYVLSSRDVVINSLRPLGHILSPNVDPPPCRNCSDALGHGFSEVYFNGQNEAGQRLARLIHSSLQEK